MVKHMQAWEIQLIKLVGIPVLVEEIPALGIIMSFKNQEFRLKPETIQDIIGTAMQILASRRCHVKLLARLAGLIVSRTHCLGPAARIRRRALYYNIEARLNAQEAQLAKEIKINSGMVKVCIPASRSQGGADILDHKH